MRVELTVNGQLRSDEVEPRLLLVHYLREVCGLRAANVGCDTTSCGACTVLLNGTSVKSCTVLTMQAADLAAGAARPKTDHRGSAEYKRHMVRTFVVRILSQADGTAERAA